MSTDSPRDREPGPGVHNTDVVQPNGAQAVAALTPRSRRRALRYAVTAQCLGMPRWHCLMSGGLATLYVYSLGGRDLAVAGVNAALFLGMATLSAGSRILENRNARRVMVTFWALSAAAVIPLLVAPELREQFGRRPCVAILAGACFLFAGCYAMGVRSWSAALERLLPEGMKRRFLGVLRMAWQSVSLLALLATALCVGLTAEAYRYRSYQFALSLFALAYFARPFFIGVLPDEALQGETSGAPRAAAEPEVAPEDRRRYRRFLVFCGFCCFLLGLSVPSMFVYLRRVLEFSDQHVLFVSAAGILGQLITFPLWGRVTRLRGERAAYQIVFFIVLIALGLWWLPHTGLAGWDRAFVMDRTVWGLPAVIFFLFGSAECGAMIALGQEAFRFRPTAVRGPLGELAPVAQWGGAGLGVLAGGGIIKLIGWQQGVAGVNPYMGLFAVNALLLLAPLWIASRERRGAPADPVIPRRLRP